MTIDNNKDQVDLQEALHLQDFIHNHSEYSKCWNSNKELLLIKQHSRQKQEHYTYTMHSKNYKIHCNLKNNFQIMFWTLFYSTWVGSWEKKIYTLDYPLLHPYWCHKYWYHMTKKGSKHYLPYLQAATFLAKIQAPSHWWGLMSMFPSIEEQYSSHKQSHGKKWWPSLGQVKFA